jgi:hypothetical protein
MPKSNRLAAGETKLCSFKEEEEPRAWNWIPAFAGMTSKNKKAPKVPIQPPKAKA